MAVKNGDVKYAGFWIRFMAYIIDMVIFIVPTLIIDFFAYKVVSAISGNDYSHLSAFNLSFSESYNTSMSYNDVYVYSLVYIIQCSVFVILYKYFLTSSWQATPGKRLMNVHVVDTAFNRISSKKAILRTSLPIIFSFIFITAINIQSVKLTGGLSSYDDNLISTARELLPNSYKKHIDMGMSDEKIIESYTFATTISYEIERYDLAVDQMIEELRKESYSYSDKELSLIKAILEEFANLSDKDKEHVKSKVNFLDTSLIYDSVYIFIFFIIFSVIFFVWYLMAAFTKQKTALHDIIAKTRVIKGRP